MFGVNHGAFWRDYLDRFHQAGAGRNVTTDETAKDIRNSRDGYCFDRVHRAGNLWGAAGEINPRVLALYSNAHANGNRLVSDAVVIQKVFSFIDTVGNRADCVTHYPF